jgi:hypothetical protein
VSWDSSFSKEVESFPWQGKLELRSEFMCGTPLRIGGLTSKKSTHSIGWDVPVKLFD